MDDFFLFSLSLGLTVLGLLWSWAVYRRRGAASAMRGTAWALVPMGAYLTGTTKFLTSLVFSPTKWAGVIVIGLAVTLYMVSGVMLRNGEGSAAKAPKEPKDAKARKRAAKNKGAVERGKPAASGLDPDLADIEKILRDRGIS